ncbi:gliding motility-associated C-terminal domain-containing protein [Hymenobacter sp. BT175]|uniref:T9SS type B sorting domain-containing protein n=1 Tax=Hymenobacter translucens TaxID=2886507 RepID=UPI001D0DCFEA|nr:gliding motility-associated C-terminal domain-containing protein [Hymenobacter translucens]MCC2548650.1 gliding motility-associated C-terminal domain-containing protein [Hymenobacter translucens]
MNIPLPRRVTGPVLVWVAVLLALSGLASTAEATHIRAGDIQAKTDTTPARNPRRIFFKMITYTDVASQAAQNPDETIFFGDNTYSGRGAVRRASQVQIAPDTYRNTYFFEHTYNAPGTYTVSHIGENRSRDIRNMSDSQNQNFYISTTFTIDPALGINHSPVLTAPAVDKAAANQVYLHNPGAYDADGDSLSFELRICLQQPGGIAAVERPPLNNNPQPVPVPNYQYPNHQSVSPGGVQVVFPGALPGQPATFTLDGFTGQLVWNSPSSQGIGDYNVAFVVREWRITPFGPQNIGEVVRDMQITVRPTSNIRPAIFTPADVCVVAGTRLARTITATDPDGNPVRLTAFGGIIPPLGTVTPSASFAQTQFGTNAQASFAWTPDCNNVRRLPYQVLFRAEDQPSASGTPLIDQRVWQITVVGPPPANLRAGTLTSSSAQLTWDAYTCRNASRILIFRKENPSTWTPGACETGIPASSGYVRIADVPVTATTYVDAANLQRGKTYCYRIYAIFPEPGGGESIASQEACVSFTGRSAVFTNVTVDRTDAANGEVTVRWTKPTSNAGFFPPVGYRLYRAVGQNPVPTAFSLIQTIASLNDTTFVDRNLNTAANAYSYRLEFFSSAQSSPGSAELIETAGPASTVRVEGTPDPTTNSIAVRWTYSVPWNNAQRPTTIFRRDPGSSTYVQVATVTGTATGGTYTDRGTTAAPLQKGATYCYYVLTNGTYNNARLPDPLLNKSQERCIALNAVPCPPVLTLSVTNCDSLAALPSFPRPSDTYANTLTWTLGNTPTDCSRAIAYYRIFYRPTAEGPFTLLDSVTQMRYQHRALTSPAGCYAVQSVDASGNRSALSNIECKDNCLFFLLPNIFTPNGDGINDTFVPKVSSPVRKVHFQVFNRWGVKIYDGNTDPRINWDGGGSTGENRRGVKVTEGVYYYYAEVEFADFNNTKRTYKGWVEITR